MVPIAHCSLLIACGRPQCPLSKSILSWFERTTKQHMLLPDDFLNRLLGLPMLECVHRSVCARARAWVLWQPSILFWTWATRVESCVWKRGGEMSLNYTAHRDHP